MSSAPRLARLCGPESPLPGCCPPGSCGLLARWMGRVGFHVDSRPRGLGFEDDCVDEDMALGPSEEVSDRTLSCR